MNNKRGSKQRFSVAWIIGMLILLISISMAVVLTVGLFATKMLPGKFIAIVIAILILLAVLVGSLIWTPRYRVRYVLGVLLSLVLCVVYGLGASYIFKGLSTAKTITTVRTETAAVGIYVLATDTRDYSENAGTYSYGILLEQDRENTDEAIRQIQQEYNVSLNILAYNGLSQLIDGLFGGQVDAIIMNSAYLDLLDDMEGYENVSDQLREVQVQQVEREIVVEAEEIPDDRLVGTVSQSNDSDQSQQDGMIFTVYISGIDNRGALIAKSRSDVNIIAAVNTATHQVALISTPRDFYVPLSISNGVPDKLTHAGIYGVNVSMETLAMLYNVNVDYYFRVNFGGFKDIIDALGGVTVDSEVSFSTDDGYSFTQGSNYVTGDEALSFVRERHAFASGDRQRGKNQMAMIKAVINKALSPELLVRYSALMEALEGSFETSVPYDTISSIVRDQLANGDSWNVVSYSADGYGDSQIPYSMSQYAYVMVPYQDTVDTAKSLIAQVYNGEIISAP